MTAERPADDLPYHVVASRVFWSQVLWTAGYSLTTGPFLSYFGQDLGAKGRVVALLLIVPEVAGVVGLFTRSVIRRFRGRKQVWLVFSLSARVLSLGIPLAGMPALHPAGLDPLWLMVGSLALSQAAQAISYVSYVAWLSDAVPAGRWGRFFAARNVGELSVLLVVPVAAGYSRDWWKSHVDPGLLNWIYVVTYVLGVIVLLVSMVPLLAIADKGASTAELRVGNLRRLREAFGDRSMRCLLIHNWWLATANGLTQAAFFGYLFGPLKVGLGATYVLLDVMHAVGIPVSLAAGVIADRRGNKRLMIVGVLVAGSSLFFWLSATPKEWWWLFAAYACWGAFPAVNIPGRNLVLKLAPPGDNAAPLALFRQVGGLLAGLSGLAGGFWLERLNAERFTLHLAGWELGSFQILFVTSLIGRLTAALWLLPIREPAEVRPAPTEPRASAADTSG